MDNKNTTITDARADDKPTDRESFSIAYSAAERKEIEKIRAKYSEREGCEGGIERLRQLDAAVYSRPKALSITVGIIGTLIMGTGMSIAMTELGSAIGMLAMPIGVAVGLLGIGVMALAYPIYNAVLRREREKAAPEILRISAELMGENSID